jgi:dTDP-4-amino-4,6-dideoxygalactose transaminase
MVRGAVLTSTLRGRMKRTVPAARPVFVAEDRARITEMIDAALQTGSLTLGPHNREFETAFAARHQVPFAIAVSSGTSALEIALRALGAPGGEVIVPANTFFATAAAVVHAGATPRFADVDPTTLALSVATVEPMLSERTVGIVPVHIGGLVPPDVEALRALCDERGLFLLEDAAHAHGSSYAGRAAGTFGHAGTFSFYPTKVMTSGEGGMIVTADERMRDEAHIYRDQGKAGFLGGDHVRMGAAWRMSEVHAAIGVVQLARLDEFIATRRRAAACYDEMLAGAPGLELLPVPEKSASNYYKYVALLDGSIDRAAFKQLLRDEYGVSMSGEVYASPLHVQPVFEHLADGPLPVAEDVCARQVCLPVHSDMTLDEASYVAESVRGALDRIAGASGTR